MEEFKQMVISRLKSAREAEEMTQADLAEALGMARSSYTQIEIGRNALAIEDLAKLPRILHRSVNYFLGLPDELSPDERELLELYRTIAGHFKPTIIATLKAWISLLPKENQVKKRVVLLPPPVTPAAIDTEDIAEIINCLDGFRQRQVHDFARWQLKEQLKQKAEERQENIDLNDLMLAVDEATPKARKELITYLHNRYGSSFEDYSE